MTFRDRNTACYLEDQKIISTERAEALSLSTVRHINSLSPKSTTSRAYEKLVDVPQIKPMASRNMVGLTHKYSVEATR